MIRGTPIPNSFIEAKAQGSSEVKSHFLSPEELEEICKKYPSVKRGNDQMFNLTKEQYLNERKAGKSRNRIVKDQKISPPALYKALVSWGIKEQSAEQEALAALDEVAAPYPSAEKEQAKILEENPEILLCYMEDQEKEKGATLERLRVAVKQTESISVAPNSFPFPTITLTYALIDFSADAIAQRLKVQEEAGELIDELEMATFDLTRTAAELYDTGQAFVGLIRKHFQDLMVDDVDGGVRNYFEKHNRRHLEKMADKLEPMHV